MLDKLISFDRTLFLALNGIHTPWLDTVMFWASKGLVWLPFYLFLLYLTLKNFRWRTLIVLVAVALTVAFSDQLSNLVKNDTHRLRPSHQPDLEGKVHLARDYHGSELGFYSAHASNTFAVAVFLILIFQKRYRYLYLLLLGWAALMSYTRIYLGVHYPADIVAGAAAGAFTGWIAGRITLYLLALQGS
jgi:undecaprenyl-diphosphatase